MSDIGDEACVHAEAFRRPTVDLPLRVFNPPPRRSNARLFRPGLRPSGGATVATWVAKTPQQKLDFMRDFRHELKDNGWCLDRGVKFTMPVRASEDSDNRYKCSMSKGMGDRENERER